MHCACFCLVFCFAAHLPATVLLDSVRAKFHVQVNWPKMLTQSFSGPAAIVRPVPAFEEEKMASLVFWYRYGIASPSGSSYLGPSKL